MHTAARSAFLHCLETTSPTSRTAVYGPVRTVCGSGRQVTAAPMPIKRRSLPRYAISELPEPGRHSGTDLRTTSDLAILRALRAL